MTELAYRSLGRSGLRVSAVGLGCNNFGRAGTHTETQDGTRGRGRGARRRRQLPRHRRHLRPGARTQRDADGRGAARPARPGRARHEVRACGPAVALPAWGARGSRRTSASPWRARCAGSRPTGSICTSCTCPTRRRRSTRRSPCSTSSCARARSATSAIRISAAGRSPRRTRRRASRRGADSSRRRTSTACSRAAAEPKCSRRSERFGLGFLPFFPLHNGLLTGKFRARRASGRHAHHAAAPARRRGRAVGRARALPGLLRTSAASRCSRRPSAGCSRSRRMSSVIAGATSPEQIRANAAAGSAWRPTAAEAAEISELFSGR